MKKYLILMVGVIMSSFTVNAQSANSVASGNVLSKTRGAQYFSLGPVAGFGHSWLSNMDGQKFKPSGYLGISLMYSRMEHWGFSDELVVSHEGYSLDYVRAGHLYNTKVDPVYLRMTPKAYYFFGQYGNTVRPKIFLGPSIAVKIAEDQYTNDNTMHYDGTTVMTNSDLFHTVDLGVEGGAGVNIKMARHIWFNVDASYYQGVLYVTDMDNMNQNVKLNLGLMFGL